MGRYRQCSADLSPVNLQISTNLGLINRTYPTDDEGDRKRKKTQWERFAFYVNRLNRDAPRNVQYKVLIMGRHGEGFHNVAEAYYGTPLWDVGLLGLSEASHPPFLSLAVPSGTRSSG